jgi:predicted MFS family arabinose efflux permease
MFFVVLIAVQLPVGVMLDWIGPRRLVAGLTVIAVAGSLLTAAARSEAGLIVARAVVGLGCAAYFMAAVLMCSRWFSGERLSTALSRVFALSQIGNLLAGWPLAALAGTAGWRAAFVIAAAVTAVTGVAFWFGIRQDRPDAAGEAPPMPESLGAVMRGVGEVLRAPGLAPVVAIQTVAYAVVSTVLGLWAGPYLHDVHGLDGGDRGLVLAAMTIAQVIGVLVCGPLDARFNTRKRIVLTGGSLTLLTLALLALWPRPPVAVAIALLVALCGVASYGVTIVAHGRSLFPDRLLGRGMTTLNLAQVVGASVMPVATGAVAAAFAGDTVDGGYPETAYRAMFAMIGVSLGAGLLLYARGPDAPPRPPGGRAAAAAR